MAPIDWKNFEPHEAPEDKKKQELLARWTGIIERLAVEAKVRLDDKEDLEEDMRMWVRRWDGMGVSAFDL
jgi:hypothetical protein